MRHVGQRSIIVPVDTVDALFIYIVSSKNLAKHVLVSFPAFIIYHINISRSHMLIKKMIYLLKYSRAVTLEIKLDQKYTTH